MSKFVLLFEGRTGSSYLLQSLQSHPNIFMDSEILERIKVEMSKVNREVVKNIQLGWVRDVYEKKYNNYIKAVGFKTKLTDVLDRKIFSEYLKDKRVKIIHMKRRNIIKQTVSFINGKNLYESTGRWNLEKIENRPPSFKIDIDEFDEILKKREETEKELNKFIKRQDLPTLDVYYEDLFQNEVETMKIVFKFIKIKYIKTKGSLLKNTDNNLKNVIINFNEVYSFYKNTKYGKMF